MPATLGASRFRSAYYLPTPISGSLRPRDRAGLTIAMVAVSVALGPLILRMRNWLLWI